MPVIAEEVPGISRDCYLDCGRATTFPEDELAKAEHRGRASARFLIRVAQEVSKRATTLTKAQREAIAAALLSEAN